MTEAERLLLDSLKRLEAQYTEREKQLDVRLNGLTARLEDTTVRLNGLTARLETMTEAYANLQQQVKAFAEQQTQLIDRYNEVTLFLNKVFGD